MTTATQKGKFGDPTKDPSRSGAGNVDVVIEVRLSGTKAQVSADYASIVGISFQSGSAAVTSH